MQLSVKLFCCALCATMPLTLAAAPLKTDASKPTSMKVKPAKAAKAAKTGQHKLKSKRTAKKVVAKQDTVKASVSLESASAAVVTPAVVSISQANGPQPTQMAASSAPQARVNPYLAEQYAKATANPYLAMPVIAPKALLADNPYLAKPGATPQPVPAAPAQPSSPWSLPPVAPLMAAPTMTAPQPAMPSIPATSALGASAQVSGGNPYLAPTVASGAGGREAATSALAKLDPLQDLNGLFNSVRNGIPALNGQDLLPTIKKVYPTGEKPLVILSFKCPTEMVGVSTPPMKALHEIVNYAFDGLNKTNMLSFNLQQVCN